MMPWLNTIPPFALPPPVQPLAMTLVDEEGRRCVQVRRASGDMPESCVDEPEVLAVSTTFADADGTVYVLGLTTSATASLSIATTGDTSVRIELRPVDEWPERVFAAPLIRSRDDPTVQFDDAIAQQTL